MGQVAKKEEERLLNEYNNNKKPLKSWKKKRAIKQGVNCLGGTCSPLIRFL
jgi:hypothetical protein